MASSHHPDSSVFGEAMHFFDAASQRLNLTSSMYRILTHPSRQVIISIPFARTGTPRSKSISM